MRHRGSRLVVAAAWSCSPRRRRRDQKYGPLELSGNLRAPRSSATPTSTSTSSSSSATRCASASTGPGSSAAASGSIASTSRSGSRARSSSCSTAASTTASTTPRPACAASATSRARRSTSASTTWTISSKGALNALKFENQLREAYVDIKFRPGFSFRPAGSRSSGARPTTSACSTAPTRSTPRGTTSGDPAALLRLGRPPHPALDGEGPLGHRQHRHVLQRLHRGLLEPRRLAAGQGRLSAARPGASASATRSSTRGRRLLRPVPGRASDERHRALQAGRLQPQSRSTTARSASASTACRPGHAGSCPRDCSCRSATSISAGPVTTARPFAPVRGITPTDAGKVETQRLVGRGTLPVEYITPYIHTVGVSANYFDNWTQIFWRSRRSTTSACRSTRAATARSAIAKQGPTTCRDHLRPVAARHATRTCGRA